MIRQAALRDTGALPPSTIPADERRRDETEPQGRPSDQQGGNDLDTERLLVIMGSGETSPTMVKVHRKILARLGTGSVPAVLIDTPFGFQTNSAEVAARAVRYFHESVGTVIEVSRLSAVEGLDEEQLDRAHSAIISARYVFAGPGSPTYALRNWNRTLVPKLLSEKLLSGGAVVFASAAALTLGARTVPVYEIYKVGEDPHWLDGLDLLSLAGLNAAVIPHFDNAEGGTHDTRYCYLGEERLRMMEMQLPENVFVLGVDEHTACVIDLVRGMVDVEGLGALTVRARGSAATIPAGSSIATNELAEIATELGLHGSAPASGAVHHAETPTPAAESLGEPQSPDGIAQLRAPTSQPAGGKTLPAQPRLSPLLMMVREHEEKFRAAVTARNISDAVRILFEMEDQLETWAADTTQSDERDRSRTSLRCMINELAGLAARALDNPRSVLAPVVDEVLSLRESARAQRRWKEADATREILTSLGIRVHDAAAGATWEIPGIDTWNDLISLWSGRTQDRDHDGMIAEKE